ncbi:glycosyltransferase [Candidatus Peregrinibacteria bacterium]|nr:glycosyltransferase [Candidatus Peregrinibacteria bacterium]
MIVGVNGRFLTKPFTGIGKYTRYLFSEMAHNNPEIKFKIAVPATVQMKFPENIEIIELSEKPLILGGLKKTYWEQVQLPKLFKKVNADLIHIPYPANKWGKTSIPEIVTVHDTIPWTEKNYSKSLLSQIYNNKAKKAVRKAKKIITVSNESKKEICMVCKVPDEKINVVYNAPFITNDVPFESTIKKFPILKKKYLLYVGGFDARKNVERMVSAFNNEVADNFDVNLVIVGGKSLNTNLYKSYDDLTDSKKRRTLELQEGTGQVIQLGFVEENDLSNIYEGALGLVNFSLKEGFNLPLIEAACRQIPVATSDIPVHHEVIDQYAIYASPNDEKNIAKAMIEIVTNKNLKQKCKDYICPYSWNKAAKETIEIYKKTA